MSETETEIQEEIVEVQDDNLEIKEVQEPENRESVIDKIKEKVSNFLSGPKEESAGDDIPEEFLSAARKLGWENKAIAEFAADYDDEQLKEMIPELVEEETSDSDDTPAKPEEEEISVEDSQEDGETQKLLDRIDALEKAQGVVTEKNEQQVMVESAQKASQIFDTASKDFEVFGKTEDLPKFPDGRLVPNSPQIKARNEVWDTAQSLQKAGLDFDSAMSTAMNAYKGKHLAADVKRSFIKDLKSRESTLSGKHTSHESANVLEYGPDVVREAARRNGIEIR